MLFFTIWPLFALICLGYVLVRRGFPDPSFWPAAERINYFLLFPALLVSSLADAPVRDPQVLRLGGAAVVTILLAALAMARTELPDLIFLDIVMPGMNGFAVLRALRRDPVTHDIPIVMISGNLQATEQFYVQRFGADDFMKKPFGRGEVFVRIQHLTRSGRLVVRPRVSPPTVPAEPTLSADEHAAIPDIAMPDPQDMAPPHGTAS